MDVSLYIGEVLMLFALLTHILQYKTQNKSIFNYLVGKIKKLFHVEQKLIYLCIGILLLFMNVLLSRDQALSLVSILHLGSIVVFLYLFSDTYVSRGTQFIKNIFYILVFSLAIQFLIALIQFFTGSSIGLSFLNESKLSLSMENVAKSHIFSNTYLRSYGTFLHPNILAAYSICVLVFVAYIARFKMFHVKHFLQALVYILSLSVVLLAQSKIALFLLLAIFIWILNEKYRVFHVKHFVFVVLLLIISIIQLIYLNRDAAVSFQTRFDQFKLQSVISAKELIVGSGIGTYRLSYDKPAVEWWNYEPVHFIPMILIKELGVPFLAIAVIILISNYSVPRGTQSHHPLVPIWILMAGIIITDHYAWDIYQGTSVFAIVTLLLYIDKYSKMYHSIYS